MPFFWRKIARPDFRHKMYKTECLHQKVVFPVYMVCKEWNYFIPSGITPKGIKHRSIMKKTPFVYGKTVSNESFTNREKSIRSYIQTWSMVLTPWLYPREDGGNLPLLKTQYMISSKKKGVKDCYNWFLHNIKWGRIPGNICKRCYKGFLNENWRIGRVRKRII